MSTPLHIKIRQYRLVSVAALVFISYLFNRCLDWVMTVPPDTMGEGMAVTGVFGALAGCWKFTLDFARSKPSSIDAEAE